MQVGNSLTELYAVHKSHTSVLRVSRQPHEHLRQLSAPFHPSSNRLATFSFSSHYNKTVCVEGIVISINCIFTDGELTFSCWWNRHILNISSIFLVFVTISSWWWLSPIIVVYAAVNVLMTGMQPCSKYCIMKQIQIGHFRVNIDLCFFRLQTLRQIAHSRRILFKCTWNLVKV